MYNLRFRSTFSLPCLDQLFYPSCSGNFSILSLPISVIFTFFFLKPPSFSPRVCICLFHLCHHSSSPWSRPFPIFLSPPPLTFLSYWESHGQRVNWIRRMVSHGEDFCVLVGPLREVNGHGVRTESHQLEALTGDNATADRAGGRFLKHHPEVVGRDCWVRCRGEKFKQKNTRKKNIKGKCKVLGE